MTALDQIRAAANNGLTRAEIEAGIIRRAMTADEVTAFNAARGIWKLREAKRKAVDYVLSFEELGALLAGRRIDIVACEPYRLARPADKTARNYACSCGVTEAVLAEAASRIPGFKLNSQQINGIDRRTIGMLKLYASGRTGVNFLEVMACPGGCVNGPCSLKK